MALFRKKSEADIRKEIKSLEAQKAAEMKRKQLLKKQSMARAELRKLKYAEEYRAAENAKGYLKKGGGVLAKGAKTVYQNLKKKEVSPAFKADFTNRGGMVSVPRTSAPAPSLRTGGFAVPRVGDNSKAFAVRLRKA